MTPLRNSAILAIHNPDVKLRWDRIAKELAHRHNRQAESLITPVSASEFSYGMSFGLGDAYLLAGTQAVTSLSQFIPKGYRPRQLDYGAQVPGLWLIDSANDLSRCWVCLFYPEPYCYNGDMIYNGASFLLENKPVRDTLFIHQIRRVFAPHEPTIFGHPNRAAAAQARTQHAVGLPAAGPGRGGVPDLPEYQEMAPDDFQF